MRVCSGVAWLIGFMLALSLVAGCGGGASAPAAGGEDAARAGWPAVVRVGLVPVEGGADTRDRYGPMRDKLRERLGCEVELISTSDYQGVITAMANDQLDFALFGPKSYVEASARADAEALLMELNREGEPGYRSIFIVPAGSSVTTLAEARGKKFAFTDPNSTSGYLVPKVVLRDEVKEPAETFFGEVVFSGAHGTSMLQVAAGELEVAATNDLDMGKMVQKGALDPAAVRVIYTSELIPGSPLAARREVPATLKAAFVAAMLEFNDDPATLERFQIGGYRVSTDRDFDIVRSIAAYEAEAASAAGEDG